MRGKRLLEEFPGMSSGYVLDFSDRTAYGFCVETANVDIHSDKYGHARLAVGAASTLVTVRCEMHDVTQGTP